MRIAIPTEEPGGLKAPIAYQFDDCHSYTIAEVDDSRIVSVEVLVNEVQHTFSVRNLYDRGVRAVVAGELKRGPLSELNDLNMTIFQRQQNNTADQALSTLLEENEEGSCSPESCGEGSCGEPNCEDGCSDPGGEDCCASDSTGSGAEAQDQTPEIYYKPFSGPIADGRMAGISYELTNESGEVLEKNEGVQYLHGKRQIVPGLERALEGHVPGDTFTTTLSPKDAYGEYKEKRVLEMSRDKLPRGLSVGDKVRMPRPGGKVRTMTIASIADSVVALDGNHPLAGQTLTFNVKVLGVLVAIPRIPVPKTQLN